MGEPTLLGRIQERTAPVAVVGLGYVGLPLALAAAAAGFAVTGFDTEVHRVEALRRGESYILDIDAGELAAQLAAGRFRPTSDSDALREAEVVVICVPTPLRQELPDMTYIEEAGKVIAGALSPGRLVILESTTYPGTTEEYLRAILESSGLRCGPDFSLGFSPERIDPGNTRFALANVPKIVGGVDADATALMTAFYAAFVEKVVPVSSPRTAEMAKLLENTYRHVNIALVNEIAILCHDLGIDVWEVIDAAATKPFGFQPFYPGPGWGGHCIPVDPAYLSWRVRQMDQTAHFVELARQINDRMPAYVVQRIADCLNEEGKSLKGSAVLVLGVAYKPDVSDVRESPALKIIARLRRSGADVQFHDPHVESITLDGGPLDGVELDEGRLRGADVVVVVTDHSSYAWDEVARHAPLILDTRNALAGIEGRIVRL
jgi:UDP-N-acetyl-D-glucosamine dehydrogenase